MKDRFRRPLAESERLWLGLNRAIIPFVNQAVLEGRGSIDFQALEHAVEKASEANPGSRLVLKGVLRGCYWIDSGKTPRIRIIKDGTWDGYGSDNAPFLLDDLPVTIRSWHVFPILAELTWVKSAEADSALNRYFSFRPEWIAFRLLSCLQAAAAGWSLHWSCQIYLATTDAWTCFLKIYEVHFSKHGGIHIMKMT